MTTVGLEHFLVVAALLFALGFYTVLTRRNAVGVLMGVELIINAANLNFVAFSRYGGLANPLAGPRREATISLCSAKRPARGTLTSTPSPPSTAPGCVSSMR